MKIKFRKFYKSLTTALLTVVLLSRTTNSSGEERADEADISSSGARGRLGTTWLCGNGFELNAAIFAAAADRDRPLLKICKTCTQPPRSFLTGTS